MKYSFAFILFCLFLSCGQPAERREDSTDGEAPEQDQYLLYISDKSGGFDIYVNTMDGSEELRLTLGAGWEWRPRFVSDSNYIVYNKQDTSGSFSIRAMNMEGMERPFEDYGLPEFSITRDGRMAAYTVDDGDATNIVIRSLADTSDITVVTDSDQYNGRPVWSNDGTKLAFISNRSGKNDLYVYSIRDGSTKRLTDDDRVEKYISWSPDNTGIVYTSREGKGPNDIFMVDPNTGRKLQLTNSDINESEIAWSPKGDFIAYHAKVEGSDDIFILNIESGKIIKITDGEAYYGEPEWVLR